MPSGNRPVTTAAATAGATRSSRSAGGMRMATTGTKRTS
uniref:Uncharacterized protein n=1 Tax=Arundo donax TaxID=35708 RepID=A0A0A9FKE1_ARUDO